MPVPRSSNFLYDLPSRHQLSDKAHNMGDGWNENCPSKTLIFEYKVTVGGAVWEGIGGMVLLEEVCHWEWALRA